MTELDDCIEKSISVQQGIYGLVVNINDVGGCPMGPHPGPFADPQLYYLQSEVVVAEGTTDDNGIYELQVDVPNDYKLCRTLNVSCIQVTVRENERIRVDVATPFTTLTVREPAACE